MPAILLVLMLITCNANADDKDRIRNLLDGFHEAAAAADFDDYFRRFASNAYFLGTDASERWSVEEFKAYAKPSFDQGQGWTYEVLTRNLETREGSNTVWFDEILMNAGFGRCRGTGVVVLEDGDWKIAHYSLTLLIPNEIADDVGRQSMRIDGLLVE